jgi:hypothetical protein
LEIGALQAGTVRCLEDFVVVAVISIACARGFDEIGTLRAYYAKPFHIEMRFVICAGFFCTSYSCVVSMLT